MTSSGNQCKKAKTAKGLALLTIFLILFSSYAIACHCGDGKINVEGEECDDGNLIDGDGCSSECKWEEGGECEPRTIGYWKQACLGHFNHEDEASMLGYLEEIHSLTSFFDDLEDFEEMCETLDPSEPATMRQRAEQQMLALYLNVASGKIYQATTIELGNVSEAGTVQEALDEAENFIDEDPEKSKDIADLINNGGEVILECLPQGFCGDGNLDEGEECDDGNAEDGDGCSSNCEIEPLTIVAHKIVCDDEADLPNWGEGGPGITEETAQDYVDSHPGCDFEENWGFQWGYEGAGNPGDNTGEASEGEGWFTFGPTNALGEAITLIYDLQESSRIWVREIFQQGYIPFAYEETGNGDDYSAEMYCHEDVEDYDNYDYIGSPSLGETYYCIAWNAWEELCGNGVIDEGEECEFDEECPATECESKCVGKDWHEYDDVENACVACGCEDNPCGEPEITYNHPDCTECQVDADCDDGVYCNGQETCNLETYACESTEPVDCGHLDDQCNAGVCDENSGSCVKEAVADFTPCDDGLFCNVGEVCLDGVCSNGEGKDCSEFDIFGIATCYWDPDGLDYTWDFRPAFTSACDEENDECTRGSEDINHSVDERCTQCMVDEDCPSTGNQCTVNECVDYACVENPKQAGTECGNGSYCDGPDECNLYGECVPVGLAVDCAYLDDQCNEGVCDENTASCLKVAIADFTPCDDGLFCNVGEVCLSGVCSNGEERDCSAFDLNPVGECDYSPDGLDWTWDFFAGFTSECNEETDTCTAGEEVIDSNCSLGCGSECESDSDCEPKIEEGRCFFGGECSLYSECSCGYEEEFCPEPGSVIDGYCYWGERACTDNGCDLNRTKMNCFLECDPETGPRGLPEIVTVKAVSEPKIECGYFGDSNEAEECWYVTSDTEFTLSVDYNGNHETFFRTRWKENFDDNWDAWSEWLPYLEPVTCPQDSIHEVEYYSEDSYCGIKEVSHFEIDIVDNQAPVPRKVVGQPRVEWGGQDSYFYPWIGGQCWSGDENSIDCWRVTLETPIEMGCLDAEPHPVARERVCFNVELDGEDATENYCEHYGGELNDNGYCCMGEVVEEFYFLEESEHNLKYYCVDGLGNAGPVDDEKFKVQGRTFEIVLNKKWNLISVPFSLLDSSAEAVFENVKDAIHVVWTYDSESEEWLVFNPGMPQANSLLDIVPGWGYWVSSEEDDVPLVVGGNLLNPIQAPPSKNIAPGWNLVGYYATGWQENDTCLLCGEEKECWKGSVYCSLGSLVDTQQGYPRWSSLWGYENCGEHDSKWLQMSICGENHEMRAGKGYWIEVDTNEIYAPATTCIWDSGAACLQGNK